MAAPPRATTPDPPATIVELVEHAQRLKGMRAEIVREVNDLFAVIAEVAENEARGKFSALVEMAGRMQDERDRARDEAQALAVRLQEAERARDDANARADLLARERRADTDAIVGALTIRDAALRMRDRLHRERMKGISDRTQAAVGAVAHEVVVQFDEDTSGYIHADERA